MTDEQPPEPRTRRARLATRRQRLRLLGFVIVLGVLIAGVSTAISSRDEKGVAAPNATTTVAPTIAPATEPNLGEAQHKKPPRALSHADPMRLWIGGDSLAGSFGPALGQTAGSTGVVDATIDYKVSSGLADRGIRDWQEHAQEKMVSEDPDAVVFIIGTNDASIANTYDSNNDGVADWEANYREKIDRMMETFVGGARHRTVFWLGPPTLGDHNLDRGATLLGPVMREEAKKYAPDVVYVDTYRLFEGPDGGYSRYLDNAKGESVQMRISDGIHFTVDGAAYLSDIVYKLLDRRWDIAAQAEPAEPIDYTIAPGSNDYVPGVGRYRPNQSGSSSGPTSGPTSGSGPNSNSSTTTPSSVVGTTVASTPVSGVPTSKPAVTLPHTTTPPTAPPVTTPVTVPHTTPPHPTPTTKPKPKP
jgi:uncharacterized protein